MSKRQVASILGRDYQAMVFWKYANEMLCKDSKIKSIGYEYDEVKFFDDVVIKYKEPQVYKDGKIEAIYIQVKYHVDKREVITLESLFEPKAIGATKFSFMDKVLKLYKEDPVQFQRRCFILYTPWDIAQNDPLYKLLENKQEGIQLDVLFDDTKTDRSVQGQIRAIFREKLKVKNGELNDEELKVILKQICIYSSRESVTLFKEILNQGFLQNNLKQWSGSQRQTPHLNVIENYMVDGIVQFDAQKLREICVVEDLVAPDKRNDLIAIQSYPDKYRILEGRTDAVLNLMPFLEGRTLKTEENYTWKMIDEKIVDFIKNNIKAECEYYVELLTSYSVIFMAGKNMRSITGIKFTPVQRTIEGKFYWDLKNVSDCMEDEFQKNSIELDKEIREDKSREDVAVVISATRDILNSVTKYIEENKKDISRVYEYKLPKMGFLSVKSGYHAWKLAHQISSDLDSLSEKEKRGCLHIFSACPMSLIFNLGKMSSTYGKIQFYEYNNNRGTYDLGVKYPLE